MDTSTLAKVLLGAGVVLVLCGLVVLLVGRLGWGRLPGDLSLSIGGLRIHLLLGLSILVSVVGTIVLNVLLRR